MPALAKIPKASARKTFGSDAEHKFALAGWRKACRVVYGKWREACAAATPLETVPAVVLDPFGGSGTTALVADRLGRDAVLCEASPKYAGMARRRLEADGGLFAKVAAE